MIYANAAQKQKAIDNVDKLILELQMAFIVLDEDTFYKHPTTHEARVLSIQKTLADLGVTVLRRAETVAKTSDREAA